MRKIRTRLIKSQCMNAFIYYNNKAFVALPLLPPKSFQPPYLLPFSPAFNSQLSTFKCQQKRVFISSAGELKRMKQRPCLKCWSSAMLFRNESHFVVSLSNVGLSIGLLISHLTLDARALKAKLEFKGF
jgi:hypothetical protein